MDPMKIKFKKITNDRVLKKNLGKNNRFVPEKVIFMILISIKLNNMFVSDIMWKIANI